MDSETVSERAIEVVVSMRKNRWQINYCGGLCVLPFYHLNKVLIFFFFAKLPFGDR